VTGEYKLTAHTIASTELAGNLLGDPAERKYIVLAPPGYDEGEQRYPVVYVLHWFEGDEYTHVSQFARAWSGLMEDGLIRPMILVFPNADNAYDGSMYLSNPVQGDYGAYITQELVSQVDAEYRTLAQRASRGVTGCSMGGNGALHLAFSYPDVFSAAAALSGIFDWSTTPTLAAVEEEGFPPVEEPGETARLTLAQKFWYALAAAAAPNPDAPPLYLDPPFRAVEGDSQRKAEPVPEVMERIFAADPQDDAKRYLEQPERLNGLLIYSGEFDPLTPAELAQAFSKELTGMGIENEFLLDNAGHCTMDFAPVFPFMDAHLAFEQQ
jgi:S-formylglutathione hydrolase FrmB